MCSYRTNYFIILTLMLGESTAYWLPLEFKLFMMSNGLYICVYWLRLNVISEHASWLEICSWMLYLNICQLLFYWELNMPLENESRDVLLWILLGMFNDGRNSFPQWLHLSDDLWHLFQWFLQPWALDAWMTGTVALCFTVKGMKEGNLDCFKWPELLYSIPPEQAYSCMDWDNGHTQFDAALISEENMVA
jgi:hypothetical protein